MPPVVDNPSPPPAEYVGPKMDNILLVVLAAPVVVLCDNPTGETACR